MSGIFIVLEGGEGSGKTTIANYLVKKLSSEGYDVMYTREPGGVKISEEIRNIILDVNNTNMDPRTEALLYAASRRQHLVEKIIPALEADKIVICDRYIDSSLAYQGYARRIGMTNIKTINSFAIRKENTNELYLPNLSIYLDVDPVLGLERIYNRDDTLNRLDKEELSFHQDVRRGYITAYNLEEYIEMFDASKPLEEVEKEVYNRVMSLVKTKFTSD